MKASRFSDGQKAFILKQGNEGVAVAEICRKAGISQADLFQLEEEVRRIAADRDATVEAARGREQQAEEAGGGSAARQGDAAGRDPPKCMVHSVRARLFLRLQPGQDEIRARCSWIASSCWSTLSAGRLTVRRSTFSSSFPRASQSELYATVGARRS